MEPIDERNAEIAALKAALESFSKMAKELKKERDEAREERDIARFERDEAIADYHRVYKARDEATAQVKIIKPNENNPVAEYFSSSNTPETDAAVLASEGQWSFVLKETCQKLERERNKATEDATNYYARLGEVEKERDEAIADRDIARLSAQDSDRAHDRMVGELEKVYKERDDAVAECKSLWSLVNANKLRAYKAERERDEARDLAQQMSESNQVLMADVRFYRKAFEDAK